MTTYEADPRHAEILITDLRVEAAKLLTPPVAMSEVDDGEDDKRLSGEQSTAFRSIAAIHSLALDRPATQHACKGITLAMANPCERHWEMLKRTAKQIEGKPR